MEEQDRQTIKLTDVLSDGSNFEISLSKLVGKKVKDVLGYVSGIGNNPLCFTLTNILLEDGSEIGVDALRDFPYLSTYAKYPQSNLDEETLEDLFNQSQ